MGISVVVTGVTGFLGKVVLEELLRCRDSLDIATIDVFIRPGGSTANERFANEVATSLCFSRLPKTWQNRVHIVECELSQHLCGILPTLYTQLCIRTTHIIHCAGSVAFSSATEEMVLENVVSALNMLKMAQGCPNLQCFVSTSTAYVSPPSVMPIQEALVPLPAPAADLCEQLQGGKTNPEDILKVTGHPNLYTLSKCIAEHLLFERRGNVPLVIARPSIISASREHPLPGWIDSFAALAGLLAGAGTGILRVLRADPEVVMDVVPVDDVARRLIEEALILSEEDNPTTKIVHVVSTVNNGIQIATAHSTALEYFANNRILRKPKVKIVKCSHDFCFRFYDILRHLLPLGLAKLVTIATSDAKRLRRIKKTRLVQIHANYLFKVFTHNTYDFRCTRQSLDLGFSSDTYLLEVCKGVQIYLLGQDLRKIILVA